jgi:hypothetical protein
MPPNPLNGGSLGVVVIGRDHTEHAQSIRDPQTVCGVKSNRATFKDFPMSADKACAPCIVGLMTAAIGVQAL